MDYLQMNGYKQYTVCRICQKALEDTLVNLGTMPLAGGFINSQTDFKKEKHYPLTLSLCKSCFTLQTREVIPAHTLFKNYFYFSSRIKTLVKHFQGVAKNFAHHYKNPEERLVVEIGCNDGEFLKACIAQKFRVVGIDPATNIVLPLMKKGIPIINDYFDTKIAKMISMKHGKADIIFSSNTLAHIEHIADVFKGIKNLLKKDGMFVFEVHDLTVLIKEFQYDMIYHEHQYYYSVTSVKNIVTLFNLEIFDVEKISTHGGSLRFYIQHKNGIHKIKTSVEKMLLQETALGLHKKATYISYNKHLLRIRRKLLALLKKIKQNNKTIVGYGASGRGTIISNYCNLNTQLIEYVIDDAPAKIGKFMPGTHQQIYSSKKLTEKNPPAYTLLFAWSFFDEIRKKHAGYIKNGGKFIVPLPKVEVIS